MHDSYIQMVRTLTSPRRHLSRVEVREFENALNDAINVSKDLDNYKRELFYGSGAPHTAEEPMFAYEGVHSDTLHGILGIATEAGELLERLLMLSEDPDGDHKPNIVEEIGDLLFYVAMLMSANGLSLHQVLDANVQKLRTRYAGKFSHERALNRDLVGEASAMQRSARP